MKHLIITSAMVFAFYIGFSKTKSVRQEMDYVVTNKGIMLPEDAFKAYAGNFNMYTGIYKLKLQDIKSIHFRSKEYCTKFVTEKNSGYGRYELLEKIGSRGEYTIYRRLFNSPKNRNAVIYVLFKGEMQEYGVNADNYQILIGFILPRMRSMIA
jgi:hypothetical protein